MKEMKLTPLQFWKWQSAVEEMNHGKTREVLILLELENQKLLIQNHQLKGSLLENKILKRKDLNRGLENRYKEVKKELEDELDVSLENCVIDPYNFSIKQL